VSRDVTVGDTGPQKKKTPLWAPRCKASGGAAGLHSHSVFTFTFTCAYTSPALPGLSGLSGRVWGSLRGRLEESSRLGRLERVVRPARERQLPLGYSQLPTAFSQPTAASTAGPLQLQARSLHTLGRVPPRQPATRIDLADPADQPAQPPPHEERASEPLKAPHRSRKQRKGAGARRPNVRRDFVQASPSAAADVPAVLPDHSLR
jgi:hypothetical protein